MVDHTLVSEIPDLSLAKWNLLPLQGEVNLTDVLHPHLDHPGLQHILHSYKGLRGLVVCNFRPSRRIVFAVSLVTNPKEVVEGLQKVI